MCAGQAHAAPLTCDGFKARLASAIAEGGDKVAQIKDYGAPSEAGDLGKVYKWSDIVGLEGNLTCGGDDKFRSFSASINYDEVKSMDEAGSAGVRLTHLASSSVCALVSSPNSSCFVLAASMFQSALTEAKDKRERGERQISSEVDYDVAPGIEAAATVGPGDVSWMIGAGNFVSVDEGRPALAPKRKEL